jgi:MoaA/NifB/PqqE/SkfB family radical SAM enzyme
MTKTEISIQNPSRTINSIDWFITTRCNDVCKFCYAPSFKECTYPLEHYKQIARRIKQLNFEWVTLCGGEPTMHPHIVEIVKYLKEIGLKVTFYSNGINLKVLEKVYSYADIISLPIDSIEDTTGNLRSKLQQKRVMDCIEMLSKLNLQPKVKIGTVATKQNLDELPMIQELIEKHHIITVWRIYQFSPAERAKQYEQLYSVDAQEFHKVVQERNEQIQNHHYQISGRSRDSNRGYCVIMDQEGELYRYEEQYNRIEKNILTSEVEEIGEHYLLDTHRVQKNWLNQA